VFRNDVVDERRAGADADDLEVGGAPCAQQILKGREIGRRIVGHAVRGTDDEGPSLVLVEVGQQTQVINELLRLIGCALPIRVDDVRRRVRRSAILERRRAGASLGVENRSILNLGGAGPTDGGEEECRHRRDAGARVRNGHD
jgi:hypothetical protein